MHPFDMQWSEEQGYAALLCFAALVLLSNSVKVALVRLSRPRAGLMRACPVGSLLWRVLRGWPARPAAGHILARLRICLPLASRTRPSQMWYRSAPLGPPRRRKTQRVQAKGIDQLQRRQKQRRG